MNETEPRKSPRPETGALASLPETSTLSSRDAERGLLGSLIMGGGGELLASARIRGLGSKAFTERLHVVIWKTIDILAGRAQPISLVTVCQELHEKREVEFLNMGGTGEVSALCDAAEAGAHGKYFLGKVMDFWAARKARWYFAQAAEAVARFPGDWSTAWPEVETAMTGMAALRPETSETMEQKANRAIEVQLQRVEGTTDTSRWVHLPPMMDQRLQPLQPEFDDWFTLIAGQSSAGKSSFVRLLTDIGIQRGQNWAVFQLETRLGMFMNAMASGRAKVNLRKLDELPHDLQKRWFVEVKGIRDTLGKSLHVWDDIYDLPGIEARVRELKRRLEDRGEVLHAIVVDYLQIVDPGPGVRKGAMREEVVAYLAKGLHRLAKQTQVPLIALVQLNREAEKNGRRPTKADLRESAVLEQAADRIFIIHVPKVDYRQVEQTMDQSRVQVEIASEKSRNGALGRHCMWFDRPWALFQELRPEEADEAETAEGAKAAGADDDGEMRPGKKKGGGF